MITYLDISLFESPAQTWVNTVNTVGVMGKGIALEFKKLYPDMFKKYRALCMDRSLDIGKLYVYRTKNKIIVNFPTKKHWKQPSHIDYIEAGLAKFVERYQDYGISSVSFPQLGCGNGELDWEIQVQPMMEKYLQRLPLQVYIHLYQQNKSFVPERLDKKWIKKMQLEHDLISADQLWEDLQQLIFDTFDHSYQLTPTTTVNINDDQLSFLLGHQKLIVEREDIEDLWSAVLQHGTIREDHFPQPIGQISANIWLLHLLLQLEYIRPITLGTKKDGIIIHHQGLQYVPSPRTDNILEAELNI